MSTSELTPVAPFEVALSFAGEDRVHADAVASLCKARGISVFYDRYEQANLWGKDLYQHLSDVYANRARFCIVFVSQHYAAKLWTSHELKAAQSRAFREKQEYILPLRLDSTSLPGLSETVGYIDWHTSSAGEIVDMLSTKLGKTPVIAAAGLVTANPYAAVAPQPAPRALLKVRPATRIKATTPAWVGRNEVHIGQAAWIADRDGFNLHATLFLDPVKSETTMGPNNAFLGRVAQSAPGRWAYSINAPQLGIQHDNRPARSREDAQATLLFELEEAAPGIGQNVQEHDESPGIRYEKFAPTSGSGRNGMRLTFSTHGAAEKVSYLVEFGQPYLSLTTYWGSPQRARAEIDVYEEKNEAAGTYMISIDQPRLTPEKPYVIEVTSDRPWKDPPTVARWEP